MTTCRVCKATTTLSLPIGIYAPFFKLRVDISKDRYALYTTEGGLRPRLDGHDFLTRVKRRLLTTLGRLGRDPEPAFLRTECTYCPGCASLTLAHAYAYDDLTPLYVDYRAPTYNRDRISVEPTYGPLADLVGQDPIERTGRNEGVRRFLMPHLGSTGRSKALDLGGSDGKFIPVEIVDHYAEIQIFDTSDAAIDESIRSRNVKKVDTPETGAYDLMMCMHVLEHVGSPRDFVVDALKYVRPGGLVYLEVPLELDPRVAGQFAARTADQPVTIHEHINLYSPASMSRLIESIPTLRLVAAEHAPIDCGWSKGTVGRYVAQHVQ